MMKDEDQKEEDVIPNFQIDDDNGDDHGLDSQYEYSNEITEEKSNNRLCLHYYDGLLGDINKALNFKLMGFFFCLISHCYARSGKNDCIWIKFV